MSSRQLYSLLIALALGLFSPWVSAERSIEVPVLQAATADWSPYASLNEGKPTGIAVDILTEVGRQANLKFAISVLPTSRLNMMFDRGQIDINFADSPIWNPNLHKTRAQFTQSFMDVREYIYFRTGALIDVQNPDDLRGKTVGVARGYYYPLFEEAFRKGTVNRYEVSSNSGLIMMLKAGRIDAAFMDDVLFAFLQREMRFGMDEFERGRELSVAPLGFKVRPEKAQHIPAINEAIRKMRESGEIRRIVTRYTSPAH